MNLRAAAIYLYLSVVFSVAAPLNEFIPTFEWQYVPEDVAVPGGLEIKMDLDKGGRWARYPPGSNHPALETGALIVQGSDSHVQNGLAEVFLSDGDLLKLEDKAYDRHFGTDIIRDYGLSLVKIYTAKGTSSDHAGRILGICLRNNEEAARNFMSLSSDVLPYLAQLEKRPVMIISALITTPEGIKLLESYNTLQELRGKLSQTKKLDNSLAKAIESLVENLAVYGADTAEICEWANICNQSSSLVLKTLSRNIYAKKENFADVKCSR